MNEMFMWFVSGLVIGIVISALYRLGQTSFGTLKIDCSNPDKDVYSIEIDDLDKLAKKQFVLLKVIRAAIFSQN